MSRAKLTRRIGWRFLVSEWSDPQARALFIVALIGMGLGLATFLISQSILSAFQRMYRDSILGFNAHVIIVEDPARDAMPAPALPQGIRGAATHFTFQEGVFLNPGGMRSVMIKGVQGDLGRVYDLKYGYVPGKSFRDLQERGGNGAPPPILLGKKIFDEWNRKNPARVILPRQGTQAVNLRDLSQSFEVIGYFESGLYEFDSKFILMDEGILKTLAAGTSRGYEIHLDDADLAGAVASALQRELPAGTEVISWEELNGPLFNALKMERTIFLIVMACIVLIATLNIGGVILLILFKRAGEMRVLRLLGMTRSQVGGVFHVQTGLMAGLTLIAGYLMSLVLAWLFNRFKVISLDPQIYMVEGLEFSISPLWLLFGAVGVLGVSFLVSRRMSSWVQGSDVVMREKDI